MDTWWYGDVYASCMLVQQVSPDNNTKPINHKAPKTLDARFPVGISPPLALRLAWRKQFPRLTAVYRRNTCMK